MPVFLIVVLLVTLVAGVAMLVVHSRKGEPNPRRRSKQRARREVANEVGNDAPRMPMGDLPPRPDRRRR